MNLNELAREISKLEGKKVQVNIAQIKEVLHCLAATLAELETDEALLVLSKLTRTARL